MKIVVFGATGSVGRHVVRQALSRGYSVTAFTRDADRVTGHGDSLRVVQGDVTDPAAVRPAVAGHDAVIVTLGAGRKGGVREAGTRTIVQAMERESVRRLVCQSTLGVGESRGNLNFLWKYVMFGLLLRPAFQDHVRQEELVRHSRLDWTIVRPSAFTDGPRTGRYRHGFDGATATSLRIARADVADFLLEQLGDESYLRGTPAVSY
ncbi:SDR family oxidoreductase [Haloechinothrix sp. YIM 98757]|uniref:SDR family oxidoreductase n=1 Tax=Haloechinothrix aidingensis TaxID=2752311 RepID=A0A838A5Q7_9PSEU|nr:SDR family oxidoreductase [Haloechinothrix aidingensis]MBA0124065.1 SDR family oxidoreductase [Haloechinothrix aidingensis]